MRSTSGYSFTSKTAKSAKFRAKESLMKTKWKQFPQMSLKMLWRVLASPAGKKKRTRDRATFGQSTYKICVRHAELVCVLEELARDEEQ
jgi:hypothetical protein